MGSWSTQDFDHWDHRSWESHRVIKERVRQRRRERWARRWAWVRRLVVRILRPVD